MPLSNLLVTALCVLAFFSAPNGAGGAEKAQARRVLIISTGSRLAPGFTLVDQQLLHAFESMPSARIETYAENLDLIRFPSEPYQRVFTEYLTAKYAEHPPDLVVLVYVGNLALPGKLLPKLFPGTPIVVAGLTEEELQAKPFDPMVTGLAQRVDPRATLELILRLQPEVRRVVVIGGTAEIDQQVFHRVKDAARSFAGRFNFDFWDNLSMAQLRQAVTRLPPDTAILYARMFRDAAGQAFISSQVGQSIAQLANVPVYVMTDASLGTAAVGGSVASIEAFGKQAGALARLILSGADVRSLPFEVRTDSVPTFNWPALKRWGIPESRLPPGSVVRFKPMSIREQYQWHIIAVLIIIAIEAAIIGDLLLQRARRQRAEAGLLESQQFAELATEAGRIGLWARDLLQGHLWANPRLRFLLGLGEEGSVGIDEVLARVHPDDRARVRSVVERAQQSGTPFDVEFRTVELPGIPERWLIARGQFVRGPKGVLRHVGTMIDITTAKSPRRDFGRAKKIFAGWWKPRRRSSGKPISRAGCSPTSVHRRSSSSVTPWTSGTIKIFGCLISTPMTGTRRSTPVWR